MLKSEYIYCAKKANELIALLEQCDDETFINAVIEAVSTNGIVEAEEYI